LVFAGYKIEIVAASIFLWLNLFLSSCSTLFFPLIKHSDYSCLVWTPPYGFLRSLSDSERNKCPCTMSCIICILWSFLNHTNPCPPSRCQHAIRRRRR